jgi:hypothetical protein
MWLKPRDARRIKKELQSIEGNKWDLLQEKHSSDDATTLWFPGAKRVLPLERCV